ncbi:hypothetical protein Nepgr_023436 [Nepenthes gracilis]|uniref:Uncharacterized protein n=1 Tax=Nepenthes gracilis TaxID=150966 RepID=A0AAD3T2U3_NEPGR|nr:hypothetical protein Nepgr_023436 [Nepenthes gracilis]
MDFGSGSVIFEGADYLSDYLSERQWRKRGGSMKQTLDSAGDYLVDVDYMIFLHKLQDFRERQSLEEEEDTDPQYKMFMADSKGYGNAYVLEAPTGYGAPVYVKYEFEDESSAKKRRKIPRLRCSGVLSRERRSLGLEDDSALNSKEPKYKRESRPRYSLRGLSCNSSKEINDLGVKQSLVVNADSALNSHKPKSRRRSGSRYSLRGLWCNSRGEVNDLGVEHSLGVDGDLVVNSEEPQSRKGSRSTYCLRRLRCRPSKEVNYLGVEHSLGVDANSALNSEDPKSRKGSRSTYNLRSFRCKSSNEINDLGVLHSLGVDNDSALNFKVPKSGKGSSLRGLRCKPSSEINYSGVVHSLGVNANSALNSEDPKSRKRSRLKYSLRDLSFRRCIERNDCAVEMGYNINHSSPQNCKQEVQGDLVDETYQIFLNHLKVDGELIVFVHEDGKRLTYEDDEESSSGFQKETRKTAPSCSSDKLGKADQCCIENPNISFRERVMKILRKPFSRNELDKLWEEAKCRKPVIHYRQTRTGKDKPYTVPGHLGKSYLDHHNDLEDEIDKAKLDHCKVLNLLRGFFFWLQHLSNKGAFLPWKDELCKAVMPGS